MRSSPLFALLFASLLLCFGLAGCIGNPEGIIYCDEQECGDTDQDLVDASDVDDEDDSGDADPGQDSEDDRDSEDDADSEDDVDTDEEELERECIITDSQSQADDNSDPTYTNIQEAYDAGCDLILIDTEVPVELLESFDPVNTNPEPLTIDRELTIRPLDYDDTINPTEYAQIHMLSSGLFNVVGPGELTLKGIEFIDPYSGDQGSIDQNALTTEHLISVGPTATLTGKHIHFSDFQRDNDNALFYIEGDANLHHLELESTKNQRNQDIGLIHIKGGDVAIRESQIGPNPHLHGAAIRVVDEGKLTIESTQISGNAIERIAEVSGAGIYCNASTITISEGSELSNNSIIFETASNNLENIELRGAGGYFENCEASIDNTTIKNNELELITPDNNGDLIYIVQGAGLFLQNSSLDSSELLVSNNEIEIDLTETYGVQKHKAGGAGIFIINNEEDAQFDRATFHMNSVHAQHREVLIAGGALGFISTKDARVEMVNSTISHNSVTGYVNQAKGTALYLRGPSYDIDETQSENCTFLGFPVRCIFNNNNNAEVAPPPPLAILRFSTIAGNEGENHNSHPDYAALHIENPDTDGTDNAIGPVISMIGIVLNNHMINSTSPHLECAGKAETFPILEGETQIDTIEYGSAANIIASEYNALEACKSVFGEEPFEFKYVNLIFSLIDDPDDPNTPPGIYVPQYDLADSSRGPCIGLDADVDFNEDQLGNPRPNSASYENCYPGAIELQSQ